MGLGPVKFGVSPIAWSNDDLPSLGGDTSLETCLREVSQIGFDGVELGGKFPREAALLTEVLRSHRLSLVSGWFSGLLYQSRDIEREKSRIAEHLGLLQALDCSVMVYADVSASIQTEQDISIHNSPKINEEHWKRYGDHLTQLGDFLAKEGMDLAYHHHMGTIIEDWSELDRMIEVTGESVGLTIDTGHAVMANIDPVEAIKKYFSRIAHVHLKDIRQSIVDRVRAEGMSFLDGVLEGMFTVPGDGVIDFSEIIQALDELSYEGWLVIEAEQDPDRANPYDYSKLGLDHIKSIIAKRPEYSAN